MKYNIEPLPFDQSRLACAGGGDLRLSEQELSPLQTPLPDQGLQEQMRYQLKRGQISSKNIYMHAKASTPCSCVITQ